MRTFKNGIIILIIFIIIIISILIIYPKKKREHLDFVNTVWSGGDLTLIPALSIQINGLSLGFACAIPDEYTGTVLSLSSIPSHDINFFGTNYSYEQPSNVPGTKTVNVPDHLEVGKSAPRSYSSLFAWDMIENEKKSQWGQPASYTPDCSCALIPAPIAGTADLPSWTTPDICLPDVPKLCVGGGCVRGCVLGICGEVCSDPLCTPAYTIAGKCMSDLGLRYTFPAIAGIDPICVGWNTAELTYKPVNINISTDAITESITGLKTSMIDPLLAPLNTLVSQVNNTIEGLERELNAIVEPITTTINNLIADINALKEAGVEASTKSTQKITKLMNSFETQIQNTITLLESFGTKTFTLISTNIDCIIDIFTKINIIIDTFFNIDLPKFYKEEYTLKTKIYNIKNRTTNLFSKLGSVIVCINVLSICIKEGLYIYTLKILYFLFNTLLIDTWKLTQYTIKYNLIDLLSTHPSLNNLIEKETYTDSVHTIVLRTLQMIRGTIDYSELLFAIGLNIVGWVEVSIDMFEYVTTFGDSFTGGETGALGQIKKSIEDFVKQISPFGKLDSFKDLLNVAELRAKNGTITNLLSDIQKSIHSSDNTSLKSMMQTICINFINCEHTDNLDNYYCKLDFNSKIKETVNDIEKGISDAQNSMYLKLYSFFIDISKPYGWSYEENKQDVDDKINSRKT